MKVELKRYTHDPDRICGEAAALCTGYTGDPLKALRGAMDSGHESVAEHAVFTFYIEGVSRVLLAQLTRHRLASYSVQSQRYCGADLDTVVPHGLASADLFNEIVNIERSVKSFHDKAKSLGIPDEDIRFYTLQGGKTALYMTANARELRHFFSLRCCNRAQWEIKDLANRMLAECQKVAPVLFYQAGPGCVRGNCPEKHPCGKEE